MLHLCLKGSFSFPSEGNELELVHLPLITGEEWERWRKKKDFHFRPTLTKHFF